MKKTVLLLGVLLSFAQGLRAQFVVDNTPTPQQLVQNVLIGNGVNAFNVTYNGATVQIGSFTNSTGNGLGLTNGIILCTDDINDLPTGTPNTDGGWNTAFPGVFSPGDPDLDNIVTPNITNDASVLEFDFVPLSDTIRFRYVFASEEYPEWVCSSFNDVFAFIISGPGFPVPTNIALIPNTTLPVAINTVNDGVGAGGSNCNPPMGSLAYSQYFVNNPLGSPDIEFDGLTVPMTAIARVIPCSTYHIKLAVANTSDDAFDSAVFLEANSFTANVLDIAVNTFQNLNYAYEGCLGAQVALTLNTTPTQDYIIPVTYQGDAVNGIDYAQLPNQFIVPAGTNTIVFNIDALQDNITEGIENVTIIFQSSVCTTDTLSVNIREDGLLDLDQSLFAICTGTNNSIQLNAVALNDPNAPGTFQWSPAFGLSNTNIRNPIATVSSPINYTVTYTNGSCVQTEQVQILAPFDVVLPELRDTALCGTSSVVLDATVPPGQGTLTYYLPNPVQAQPEVSIDIPLPVAGVPAPFVVPGLISSVCMDITQVPTAFQYFLELSLVAPSGEVLPLTIQNGAGVDFTNVCFTPASTDNVINYQSLPILPNANLAPQGPGDFSVFNGATINGDWYLRVNNFVPAIFGNAAATINSFSISFSDLNTTQYTWTPTTTLSCGNCPAPTATPVATTTYNVTATNAFGCTDAADIAVFTGVLPTPVIDCGLSTLTTVTFDWSNIAFSDNYTVTIDGGAPFNTTATEYTVTGLTHPQSVTVTVVAQPASGVACAASAAATAVCQTSNCPVINPQVIGDQSLCPGEVSVLAAQAGFVGYEWSNGLTGQTITVQNGGNYGLTVTDSNGCRGTATIPVIESVNPVPNITGSTAVCFNGNSQLDAGAGFAGYIWATPAGVQNGQFATATYQGNYIVTVTNTAGCTASDMVTVANVLPPTIVNPREVCDFSGTFYTVDFTISGGAPASYTVTGVGGTLTGNYFLSNLIPVGTTPTISVDDANGCGPATFTPVGTCPPPPACSPVGCVGTNLVTDGTFSAFSPANPTQNFNTEYTPNNGNGTCTPGANCTTQYMCQSGYAVMNSAFPCNPTWAGNITDHTSGAGNMMIVDFPTGVSRKIWCQTVNLQPQQDYCFGAYFINILPATSTDPDPVLRFSVGGFPIGLSQAIPNNEQWTFEGIQFNSGAGGAVEACIWNDNFGLVGYDLALDDVSLRPLTNGTPPSLSVDSMTVCSAVPSQTTINVLGNDVANGGGTLQGTTLTIESNPPFSEMTINSINSTTGEITFTPTAGFSGVSTFTYRVCDNNGCCSTQDVHIRVRNGLSVDAGLDQTACDFGGGVFITSFVTTDAILPATFTWSDGSMATDPFFSGFAFGTTTFTVTVTDASGCSATDSFDVIVVPAPIANIVSNSGPQVCNGEVFTLTAQGGTPGVSTYFWGNGETTQSITANASGNYTVQVSNAQFCDGFDDITITSFPSPTVSITNIVPAGCNNNAGTATAGATPAASYTYHWSTGQNTATVTGLAAGTYTVTVTRASIGCTATATVTIVPSSNVSITLVSTDDASCSNTTDGQALISIAPASTYNILWSNGNTTLSPDNLGAGTYSVTATDANSGCTDTLGGIEILDGIQIVANAGIDQTIFAGQTATLTGSPSGNYTYLWTGSDGFTGNTQSVNVSPLDTTEYVLLVTEGACSDADTVMVFVPSIDGSYLMPNVFTPDGVEPNNSLFPIVNGDLELVEFKVFNRWGKKVHDSNTQRWDGTFNGEAQLRDTYIYQVKLRYPDGREITGQGDVTLMR